MMSWCSTPRNVPRLPDHGPLNQHRSLSPFDGIQSTPVHSESWTQADWQSGRFDALFCTPNSTCVSGLRVQRGEHSAVYIYNSSRLILMFYNSYNANGKWSLCPWISVQGHYRYGKRDKFIIRLY